MRLAKLQKKHCNAYELNIVEKNLCTNFYWAHEENILANVLMSEKMEDRSFAENQRWIEVMRSDTF